MGEEVKPTRQIYDVHLQTEFRVKDCMGNIAPSHNDVCFFTAYHVVRCPRKWKYSPIFSP